MPKIKVALIGTGGRSCSYAAPYAQCDEMEIVALADPVPDHRRTTAARCNVPAGYAEYDDWRELLDRHPDLDAVAICTPNDVHADPGIACLERGLPIALEKPLAHTKSECERIIGSARRLKGRTLIGFVLRSTPFYSTIQRLIAEGRIGTVVSIQADELPGWGVSSIMNRSNWRRLHARSGGAMLEKCCHDMDILNWLMGCRPRALCSFGGTRMFAPNPSLPATCDGCPVGADCKYFRPTLSSQEDKGEEALLRYVREEGACIYNIGKDIVDTQSLTIEYENGAVANFLMNMHTAGPRSGRNFHAVGTYGRIWGNLHEKRVCLYDNRTGKTEEFDTSGDGTGHGGGDRNHAMLLRRMVLEPEFRPAQDAEAGYLSAVVCFAADRSMAERRRVEFTYREDGFVDIV